MGQGLVEFGNETKENNQGLGGYEQWSINSNRE